VREHLSFETGPSWTKETEWVTGTLTPFVCPVNFLFRWLFFPKRGWVWGRIRRLFGQRGTIPDVISAAQMCVDLLVKTFYVLFPTAVSPQGRSPGESGRPSMIFFQEPLYSRLPWTSHLPIAVRL